MYYRSKDRVVYRVVSGPLAGRINYVQAYYHAVRENVFNITWLEETGTIVTQTLDLENKRIFTTAAFSKGHAENHDLCKGTKMTHLEQWRDLAKIGIQTDRKIVRASGVVDNVFNDRGDVLPEIEDDWPVL
ncbi:Calycin-like protein [Fusarium solani]|uniref:Calycin-like protein n=1 Tax=Fusarium solani TaxID=169388 RepID=A0A9P9JRB5_FUSSL|nr:Calycin-like protein [Fusarium solani]KAH7230336.1 Calycin-like protein [Fusarium solani]